MSDRVTGVDDESDERGRAGAVAHRALWIVGVALVVFAVGSIVWAVQRSSSSDGSNADLTLAQTAYFFGPGALAGGIACIGLALAVSVIRSVLLARDGSAPEVVRELDRAPGAHRVADVPPHPHEAQDPDSRPARPLDPEAFKRPRSASDPRP